MPRLIRAVVASLLVATSLAACTPHDEAESTSGVSDAMVQDANSLLRSNGLFAMPEGAGYESAGLLSLTWQYADALGARATDYVDIAHAVEAPLPEAVGLVEAQALLGLARAADANPDPAALERAAEALGALPEVQGDAGGEIAALWIWATAQADLAHIDSTLSAPGEDALRQQALARLSEVPLGEVVNHPYLALRMVEAYRALGEPAPTALASAHAALEEAVISDIGSTEHLLDAVAVAQVRRGSGRSTELSPDVRAQLGEIAEHTDQLEDLTVVAALTLARETGDDAVVQQVGETVKPRVSSRTGLVAAQTTDAGTVDATYLVARLLDHRFSEIAADLTRDQLFAILSDGDESPLSRLKAAAALKIAGDSRWEDIETVADDVSRSFPARIAQDQAAAYIENAEVLTVLSPQRTPSELVVFEPGDDESAQRIVAAALQRSYLFANPEDVAAMAPEFQQQMKGWLDEPSTPVAQLVAAGAALPVSSVVRLDSADLDRVAERVAGLRGCDGATTFLSVDGTDSGTCSLLLTVQAAAIPAWEAP